MYNLTGDYTAEIKIYRNNTWEWLSVDLRRSDMDYIYRRCSNRRMCTPTLQKRGKEWFLDFPFEEKAALTDTNDLVVGVDLGLNSACTCCIMDSKGTIYGRHFLSLPSETDRLTHALNRIKKAHQYGNNNCDLNASYNIAARYYIRELIKSCPVTDRLVIEAKVPQCSKRSTCTLADLISLNAVLDDLTVA